MVAQSISLLYVTLWDTSLIKRLREKALTKTCWEFEKPIRFERQWLRSSFKDLRHPEVKITLETFDNFWLVSCQVAYDFDSSI